MSWDFEFAVAWHTQVREWSPDELALPDRPTVGHDAIDLGDVGRVWVHTYACEPTTEGDA